MHKDVQLDTDRSIYNYSMVSMRKTCNSRLERPQGGNLKTVGDIGYILHTPADVTAQILATRYEDEPRKGRRICRAMSEVLWLTSSGSSMCSCPRTCLLKMNPVRTPHKSRTPSPATRCSPITTTRITNLCEKAGLLQRVGICTLCKFSFIYKSSIGTQVL